MLIRALLALAVTCGALWPAAGWSQSSFGELTSRLPRSANAVLAIDAVALKNAPLAKERGWAKKLEAAYADRSLFLPPDAERLVIASQVDPGDGFKQAWESAVVKMGGAVSMATVARSNKGQLDEIRGRSAVALPGDTFIVSFDRDVVGMYSPGKRQAVSNWVGDALKKEPGRLSDYLAKAVAAVSAGDPIVMAIDLEDAVSPQTLASRLEKAKITGAGAAEQFQSLSGVTLRISIASKAMAHTVIDFGKPLTTPAGSCKELIIATLSDLGAELPDLANHKFAVSGSTITIDGELSASGLRRILSLLEMPTQAIATSESSATDGKSTLSDPVGPASAAYFKSVVTLIDDLRGDRDKQNFGGSGPTVAWLERYAQKIDRLPVLDVDPEVLDWGGKTAQTMRVMTSIQRQGTLTAGVQKSALRTGVTGDSYYGWSYTSATGTALDASQIDRTQQAKGSYTVVEGWRRIDDATSEIKKKMTQRYRIEF